MNSVQRGDRLLDEVPVEVVVFDFDGVCTPSHREFVSSTVDAIRPGLVDVVGELRERGCTVVLLSNEFDRAWLSSIDGMPTFDHVFVGSDNGISKPDRRAFQRVLLVAGCAPDACLVVDDDEINLSSARSIGCRVVLFDPADVEASWHSVLTACARA